MKIVEPGQWMEDELIGKGAAVMHLCKRFPNEYALVLDTRPVMKLHNLSIPKENDDEANRQKPEGQEPGA
jgi:hypothetical protein